MRWNQLDQTNCNVVTVHGFVDVADAVAASSQSVRNQKRKGDCYFVWICYNLNWCLWPRNINSWIFISMEKLTLWNEMTEIARNLQKWKIWILWWIRISYQFYDFWIIQSDSWIARSINWFNHQQSEIVLRVSNDPKKESWTFPKNLQESLQDLLHR